MNAVRRTIVCAVSSEKPGKRDERRDHCRRIEEERHNAEEKEKTTYVAMNLIVTGRTFDGPFSAVWTDTIAI